MDNTFMDNMPANDEFMNEERRNMNNRMMNDSTMNNPRMNNSMINDSMMNERYLNNNYVIGGILNDTFVTINRGRIEEISRDNRNTLITVAYRRGPRRDDMEERLRMVVNNRTLIFDEYGNLIRPSDLFRDMIINAVVSSDMSRSIPPQATAYAIRILRRPVADNVITGRIIDVDRDSRMFTIISGNTPNSIIRFSVPMNTPVYDMQGRPMGFARLFPGLRVQVRHADFMTASIPPQTTAFEIRVL